MKNQPKILLFIPGYNCARQITRVLAQLTPEVMDHISETIFINNCSTDNTESIVKKFQTNAHLPNFHIFRNTNNYGLGGSHKVAFNYALSNQFDFVITLHGDDQANISDILPILKTKEYQKYDSMLGSRFMPESKLQGYSRFRTFGNQVYNKLFSLSTHQQIQDLGSGLNIYKTKSLQSKYYLSFPDDLTFNYCMILAANYYHQNIAFFPISWREKDQSSNVKLLSQATKVLGILAKYSVHHDYIKSEFRRQPFPEYTYQEITA